ncbi:hypothetical protein [Branchiibius sp. NY16-3462-2]|uniref:hypothetical protein n=1 Tax=Branchiibius sp. NY16-3462-2 TaxID=1807500 RepID=UPI0007969DA3|nr:hypothetical protein [Branchiibius sp. NY16-3462-2]KYH43010.1 hypothetical protein AZH51_06045 [Branchiibius sp. NY16-3462-2]
MTITTSPVPALLRLLRARLRALVTALIVAVSVIVAGAAPADAAIVGGRIACDQNTDTAVVTNQIYANTRNVGNGQYISVRTVAIDVNFGRVVYSAWSSAYWAPVAGAGQALTLIGSVRVGIDWNKTLLKTQIAWWTWNGSRWTYTVTSHDTMYGGTCNFGGYVIAR